MKVTEYDIHDHCRFCAVSHAETHQNPSAITTLLSSISTTTHSPRDSQESITSPRIGAKLSQTIFARSIMHSCVEMPLSYIPLPSHHIQPRVKLRSSGIARDTAALGHGSCQYPNFTFCNTQENIASRSGTTTTKCISGSPSINCLWIHRFLLVRHLRKKHLSAVFVRTGKYR
jgi:hypothetical protein